MTLWCHNKHCGYIVEYIDGSIDHCNHTIGPCGDPVENNGIK